MLNVPGWQEGRTDPSAPANASGTICVMDTGFDANHPDLKNVLYEFTEEQQAKYNCGPNGINVSYVESEGGDPKDISDHNEHGSHVAGIIAAQWNEFGTSGIANGIRIFGARIFGDDGGASSSTSAIRAFQFLIKVAEEIQICGIPGGIVMVGDSVEGTDTYMLMDSEKTLRPCPRKSTYHRLNYATAAVQTTGYQIRCSTNKNFKTGTKTVTIRNNKTTQKTISGLKAKKTYYVQIRTYKKTGGKTYYSAWSKKKSVKTR